MFGTLTHRWFHPYWGRNPIKMYLAASAVCIYAEQAGITGRLFACLMVPDVPSATCLHRRRPPAVRGGDGIVFFSTGLERVQQ